MPFKIKKSGSYSDSVATKIKLSGAYQAVQGIFCKVAGAYQSVLSSIPPDTYITSLFSSGEQGCWYDPSDMTTMWQDSAGTTPVTAAGQPVGKILDKSGRGNHATQATAGSRPTLQTDETGNYYLSFAGAQFLDSGNVALTGTANVSVFAAARRTAETMGAGDNSPIVNFGLTSQAGSFNVGYYGNAMLAYRRGQSGAGAGAVSTSGSVSNLFCVSSTLFDLAGSTHTTEIPTLRVNGVNDNTGTTYLNADTGTGNFGTYPIRIGRFNANYMTGRIYQVVVRGATSNATEISNAEAYIAYKMGIGLNLTYTSTPTQFTNTGAVSDQGTHLLTSTFASVDYTTSASVMQVETYNNIYGTYPAYTEIGVFVDGAYYSKATPGVAGAKTLSIPLPKGNKTVSLVNGLQSKPSTTLLGTFIKTVSANAPITQTNLGLTGGMVVYGDSIASGADATGAVTQNAWALSVRSAYPSRKVAMESYGFRALHDDASDATKRAAFVAKLAAYSPAKIWLTIGTNDYGLNKWSAASFGAAYAALLDDLAAAIPGVTIYCQTPILRTTETANGSGSTLGDYRTQIANAQSSRSSFCTLVDGTTFMTTGSLSDGVHPTAAGHALYATAVKTVLGI